MLKKMCLLLISLNLGLFFSFGDTLRLTHDGNVRAEPSANSSVIQAIKKDSHIEGYIYNKDWYKVSLGTKKGYLHRTVAAVELKDAQRKYIIDDYDSSGLFVKNDCFIYKPFVKFIEFHPRWSIIIGIILCVISFVIVFILLENIPFKLLRILCVLFIIFTVIGMFGSCTKPSTIKTSWDNAWSLFDGYTYEITETEFTYKNINNSITFPYKIENDYICLSPAIKGDYGQLPPIQRRFQYVREGRFLTLFFDEPEKCISSVEKEMSRIGVLGAIGDVIIPAVAIVVAALTNNNNDSDTQGFTSQEKKSPITNKKLTPQNIKDLQDAVDKSALEYNTKNNPYKLGLKKGLIGIEMTKNGGVDFRNTKYLYGKKGVNPIVRITLTGDYGKDFTEANRLAGLPPTPKPPKGYTWHHLDDLKVEKDGTATCTMELIHIEKAHKKIYPHKGGYGQFKKFQEMLLTLGD